MRGTEERGGGRPGEAGWQGRRGKRQEVGVLKDKEMLKVPSTARAIQKRVQHGRKRSRKKDELNDNQQAFSKSWGTS